MAGKLNFPFGSNLLTPLINEDLMLDQIAHNHTARWTPDPYAPLETPPWHVRQREYVEDRVRGLLRQYRAGEISWETFINDRDMGLKNCLWWQHHKHNELHKNLGRPFWSVAAYRMWVENLNSLPDAEARDRRGNYTLRTLQLPVKGKLRKFLRHEHVIPKHAMIAWLLREPDRVAEILNRNICCVVTRMEDAQINKHWRTAHPDLERPWLRYEGTGIRLLHNPNWSPGILRELEAHDLIDATSYDPGITPSNTMDITSRSVPGLTRSSTVQ
jgi:hypothetical protein